MYSRSTKLSNKIEKRLSQSRNIILIFIIIFLYINIYYIFAIADENRAFISQKNSDLRGKVQRMCF